MGLSPTLLNEILNGKRSVSTEYALLFEAALGIDAEIWIRLQADYDMQKANQTSHSLKDLPIFVSLQPLSEVTLVTFKRQSVDVI